MSALVARMSKTLYSPPRMLLVVLALTAVSVTLIVMLMQSVQARESVRPVLYGVEMITPVESAVCPGPNALRYPVTVVVDENSLPDQVTPAEAWCVAGPAGMCRPVPPRGDGEIPLLAPKLIETVAARDVPAWLQPGVEYELHHSIRSASGEVSGYIVRPIVLREDCPQ